MCFSFLEVSVFFFLLLMIVRGYQRGLLKLSIGLLALLSSVIALNVVNPYIRNQLQENTKINQFVLTTIYEKIGLQNMQGDTESDMDRSYSYGWCLGYFLKETGFLQDCRYLEDSTRYSVQ